ncbi:MAG: hypothetical protein U0797_22275 [Gemmataceae bacterium]
MTTRLALALLVALAFAAGAARPVGCRPNRRPEATGTTWRAAWFRRRAAVRHPADLHDGVKHIVAAWVKEVPYGILNGPSALVLKARPPRFRPTRPTRSPQASAAWRRCSSARSAPATTGRGSPSRPTCSTSRPAC